MTDWMRMARDFQIVARIGDLCRVNAPADSMARKYNGQTVTVSGFDMPGWVDATIENGDKKRFRPDELQHL